MVFCWWRFMTTVVLWHHDWVCTMPAFILIRFVLWSGCVPSSSSAHRVPGKKAAVPIYKVLVRPGQETNSRPTSSEGDALTTRPRAGHCDHWERRIQPSQRYTHVNCPELPRQQSAFHDWEIKARQQHANLHAHIYFSKTAFFSLESP